MSDLIHRLRALSRAEHDDLTVAGEAADVLNEMLVDITRLMESWDATCLERHRDGRLLSDVENLRVWCAPIRRPE